MKNQTSPVVAVIGDLVGSREHVSRRDVQRGLLGALDAVTRRVDAVQPLAATIGDEFQGVYATIGEALRSTALVRLLLPQGLDARFGLGIGTLEVVGESAYGLTQDGPAWWAARDAVEEAETRQRKYPALRTWARAHETTGADVNLVNAYALCRDQLLTDLDDRQRRIALGVLDGRTLAELADDEGISASAVSQRYRRGIGALVESIATVAA